MAATPNVALRRRGAVSVRLLAVVPLVIMAGGGSWWLWRGRQSTAEDLPLMCQVEQAEFIHELTEEGTVESANNAEIRCEVKSNNTSGSVILDIVPEGTMVEEGQEVAHLDSSTLETDRTKQESAVNTAEADLIKARTAVRTAELALNEYKDGTFPQLMAAAKGDVAVAEENLGRAKEYARYSARLEQKGYITKMQLEADEFAVEKASNDLIVAKSKLDVLKNFTYATQIQTLTSDIETARAKLKSQENIHKLESDKLAFIKDQIQKCTLRAPCAGQVVFATTTNQWGDKTVIEVGASVRERQPVIRLPDRTQLLVKVRINESKIALVKAKQPATIRVDALPDKELLGTVEKVEEYPIPNKWFSSAVKAYETTVRVHNAPEGLRPGLTAQVSIRINRLADTLQLPVQAVIEHGNQHFCVVPVEGGFEAREVKIGATNDNNVVIRAGLAEADKVVHNAAAYRDKVTLPDLPPETQAQAGTMVASAPPRPEKKRSREVRSEEGQSVRVVKTNPAAGNRAATAEKLFVEYDKDRQGRIKLADLPQEAKSWLSRGDSNRDGMIDRKELTAILAEKPQAEGPRADAAAHPGTAPARTARGHG